MKRALLLSLFTFVLAACIVSLGGNKNSGTIQKKLDSIVLDRIEFEDVSIATVIKYFKERSKQLDPQHHGVNLLLLPFPKPVKEDAKKAKDTEVTDPHKEVTVTMVVDDIRLIDAIKYVCHATGYKYRIDKYAVVIAPKNVAMAELETRIYPMEKGVFE